MRRLARRWARLLPACAAALLLMGCAQLEDAAEEVGRAAVEEVSKELLGTLQGRAPGESGEEQGNPGQHAESSGTEDETEAQGVQERAVSGILEIHFLDVGQGDCILVKNGEHAMLIDAGNNGDGDQICGYLREQGVFKLDYCIGTHPHADHIGAMDDVIRNMEVGELILPDKIHTTKTFEDVLDAAEEKGLGITTAAVGDTYACGEASFVILGPVEDYGDDLNNWSVGIRLSYGGTAAVFAGDAESAAEADMCGTGLALDADLWKAGHHGSSTSNSPQILDAVSPSYAVICCGEGNSYGHPHAETLEEFRERGIQVFRTDEQGTVVAYSDGEEFSFSCEPSTTWAPGTASGGEES